MIASMAPASELSRRERWLEPPPRHPSLRPQELWDSRELLWILAARDVRVRYKQALLGAGWAVLQPLVMMGIFTLLFGAIAGVPTDGVPYPVFVFTALVPWTMFANGTASASQSLVSNQALVSKVYFPRLLIPTASICSWIPDFLIGSVLLGGLMLVFGVVPPITALLLPVVLLGGLMAALSVSTWLSALNVAYRDVQYVVPFLLQAWLFLTPVAYPVTIVPENLRWLAGLNPMSWVVDLSRWALLGSAPSIEISAISLSVTIVLLGSGLIYFRRVERYFADVI